MTLTVELPWPARALHPNARLHWSKKVGHTRTHRRTSYFLTVAAARAKPASTWPERIKVRMNFYPPTVRSRDRDGLISNCKAYLDGIAEALGVDDCRFDIMPVEILDTVKGGKVLVILE